MNRYPVSKHGAFVLLVVALYVGPLAMRDAQAQTTARPKKLRFTDAQTKPELVRKINNPAKPSRLHAKNNVDTYTLTLSTSLFSLVGPNANAPSSFPAQFNLLRYEEGGPAPVGPVIRVKPGNLLKIQLKNNLKAQDNPAPDQGLDFPRAEFIHKLATTNLHTHGLHVSPSDNANGTHGDNIFIEVAPGGNIAQFEYQIPNDHPTGTYWYHPHKHGSVGYQLANGLAGALIVEGDPNNPKDLESFPEIAEATKNEQILVLQWMTYSTYSPNKDKPTEGQIGFIDARSKGTYNMNANPQYAAVADIPLVFGVGTDAAQTPLVSPIPAAGDPSILTINGQLIPTYTLKAGEVQRWRLIHAGWDQLQQLSWGILNSDNTITPTDDIVFHEIALDGIATGRLSRRNPVEIAPGQRSDLLVKVNSKVTGTNNTYVLTRAAQNTSLGTGDFSTEPLYIAKLQIQGVLNPEMKLPNRDDLARCRPFEYISDHELTDSTIPLPPGQLPGTSNTLAFRANDPADSSSLNTAYYTINDKTFTSHLANPIPLTIQTKANPKTSQEWNITAGSTSFLQSPTNSMTISDSSHPFHIHVNPFQVVEFTDLSGLRHRMDEWRDTLFVPAGTSYRIRLRFKDLQGYSVLHCHILDHEDQGMMMPIKIIDPNGPPLGKPPWAAIHDQNKESGVKLASASLSAPTFNIADLSGKTHALTNYRGKRVVLVFFAGIQCSHCATQLHDLLAQARNDLDADTEILAISSRKIPDKAKAAERLGLQTSDRFELLVDEQHSVFRRYGCIENDTPKHGLFLIDHDGVIRKSYVGDGPFQNVKEVFEAIRVLTAFKNRQPDR